MGHYWSVRQGGCGGGNVVDDNGCVFESIDADCVTCACLGSMGLDVGWPLKVPPEVEISGEASHRVQ